MKEKSKAISEQKDLSNTGKKKIEPSLHATVEAAKYLKKVLTGVVNWVSVERTERSKGDSEVLNLWALQIFVEWGS